MWVANIRGGGEFGPKWHQAALKANRHRAYEDFAAVAEDLVKRKVTSPQHLGARGGSNGGLLMGNMLTLYPGPFQSDRLPGAIAGHGALQQACWLGRVGWRSTATPTSRTSGPS